MSSARRMWRVFQANRRATWAGWFLCLAAFLSFTAELWSNDQPLVLSLHHELYFPVLKHYSPATFGQHDTMVTDFQRIAGVDWAVWPLNRWNAYQINKTAPEFPAAPSADNWLGTDDRGRDVLARLLYGFRYSLAFAVVVWLACSILALVYGASCGFVGGWVDLCGQRLIEILSTVPQLLFLIIVLSMLEPSLPLLIGATCLFNWMGLSFFVRGEVLKTRELEYVEAARALGASPSRLLFRSILPNCCVQLLTLAPFVIVANISMLAGLDFMGLGLPAPTPSWGELLQQAQTYFAWAWWLALYPAFMMFLTLLALTWLGEGLRQALDPNALVKTTRWRRWRWQAVLPARAIPGAAFALALLTGQDVHADQVQVESLRSTLSNPMEEQGQRVSWGHARPNKNTSYLGLRVEMFDGQADFVHFEGLRGLARFDFQLSGRETLKFGIGFHRLRDIFPPDMSARPAQEGALSTAAWQEPPSPTVEDHTLPIYSLEYHALEYGVWEWTVDYTRDFVYQEWVDAASACHFLKFQKMHTRLENVLPGQRWRTRLNLAYSNLSDGNGKMETDDNIMYEIINRRDWVLVGAGVWGTGFHAQTNDYWSPQIVVQPQMRTEWILRWTPSFSNEATVTVGPSLDADGNKTWSHYVELHAKMNLNSWSVSVGWTMFRSEQWHRNDVSLVASAPL